MVFVLRGDPVCLIVSFFDMQWFSPRPKKAMENQNKSRKYWLIWYIKPYPLIQLLMFWFLFLVVVVGYSWVPTNFSDVNYLQNDSVLPQNIFLDKWHIGIGISSSFWLLWPFFGDMGQNKKCVDTLTFLVVWFVQGKSDILKVCLREIPSWVLTFKTLISNLMLFVTKKFKIFFPW